MIHRRTIALPLRGSSSQNSMMNLNHPGSHGYRNVTADDRAEL
jgi:hypothetical protein